MKHTLTIAILLAICPHLPAVAGEGTFEITAGAYVSDSSIVDDEATFGVRGGYRFTDRWAIQGSITRSDLFDVGSAFLDLGVDATFFDVSGMYFITPNRKAEFFVYGGVGMARFDVGGIRIDFPRIGGFHSDSTIDDEFTTHLGLGVNIRLTDKMYLRPDLRSRWFNSFDGGNTDVEPSIGLGWRF